MHLLKLILSLPRDVVACHVIPFFDLVELTQLDFATLSVKCSESFLLVLVNLAMNDLFVNAATYQFV